MKYDFIVVGAGIAGSYFADIASKYASILVLDKLPFDRINLSSGVFPNHNFIYFDKDNPAPIDNKKIFIEDQYTMVYSCKEHEGVVDGREFGGPIGKLIDLTQFVYFLNKRAEKNGVEIKFNTEVTGITISNDGCTVNCKNNEVYACDVVLLGTGAGNTSAVNQKDKNTHKKAFTLQTSLGFAHPDIYFSAITRYIGDHDTIAENMENQYIFHYNRKISKYGPGPYAVRFGNHFDLGVIAEESHEFAIKKMVSIVKKYPRLQPYFNKVKPIEGPNINTVEGIPIFKTVTSKHCLNKKAIDRVILLGESAGLVTDLFYEGVVGGLASARAASDVLKDIMDNRKSDSTNINAFNYNNLEKYDKVLNTQLLDRYLKSQHGMEILFLNSGDLGQTLFNTFCKLLANKKNKEMRRYVYEVLTTDDFKNYSFDYDKISGERIFKALPLAQKLIASPIFLKAAFK